MKTILVTGAASGLGWALTRQWFDAGHRVVLVDRNADLLHKRANQLGDEARVLAQVADLTDSEAQARLVAATRSRFGGLDVLVNNAGITQRSLVINTDIDVFRRVMDVDWRAPLELAMRCLPLLQERAGSIINIGSMAGWMPVLGRAGYCAAKAALAQSFEVLRAELSGQDVQVLMVYPSFLDTPIEQNALGADGGRARHARTVTGAVRSADWMAARIIQAHQRGRRRLFPDRLSAFGSVLWRLSPDLYLRMMTRRFARELEQ